METLVTNAVEFTADGYLKNMNDWTPKLARQLATGMNLELTPKHFEVLNWLREKQKGGEQLTIRKVGTSGIADIKEFYQLFPGGPLKVSSKLAGIPKPTSCI